MVCIVIKITKYGNLHMKKMGMTRLEAEARQHLLYVSLSDSSYEMSHMPEQSLFPCVSDLQSALAQPKMEQSQTGQSSR